MKSIAHSRMWVAIFALAILSNGLVLGLAAWNRSGEPDSVLHLTSRELRGSYHHQSSEDRERVLLLQWSAADSTSGGRAAAWLDADKMRALGFDLDADFTSSRLDRPRALEKHVYLVLELDGPAYRKTVAQAEEALKSAAATALAKPDDPSAQRRVEYYHGLLNNATSQSTRLLAVDAGLDADVLRKKYPDRLTYAIIHGRIELNLYPSQEENDARGLIIYQEDKVNVPLSYKDIYDKLPEYGGIYPSFRATIAFGKRHEPWLQTLTMP